MSFLEFQAKGLSKWKNNGYKGALFFEPGLGKSYSAQIALLLMLDKQIINNVLIVVPSAIIDMWRDELIEKGALEEELFVIEAGVKQEAIDEVLSENVKRIVIITYGLLYRRTIPTFDLYVLDESHNIKSPKSKAYKAARKLVGPTSKVLLLSGTPVPSSIEDFFSQFQLIAPGYLASNLREFRARYERKKYYGAYTYVPKKDSLPVLRSLITKYASFKKAKGAIVLPEMTSTVVSYSLNPEQELAMMVLRSSGDVESEDGTVTFIEERPIRMMIMQQICSGFVNMDKSVTLDTYFAFDEMKEIRLKETVHVQRDYGVVQKEELLVDRLRTLGENKQHCLVWISFTHTAARLAERLEQDPQLKDTFGVIVGSTSKKQRKKILDDYDAGKILFIIAHPKTLGTGLNRFSKNTQYIEWYELTPDFALVEQANGRIYRKGQENPVFIRYYIAKGDSVERRVLAIIKNKTSLKEFMFSDYFSIR